MGLSERFEEVLNTEGINYLSLHPLLKQRLLDAVCAEWRMHDFPRHHAKYGGDDSIRVAIITGPCSICGVGGS